MTWHAKNRDAKRLDREERAERATKLKTLDKRLRKKPTCSKYYKRRTTPIACTTSPWLEVRQMPIPHPLFLYTIDQLHRCREVNPTQPEPGELVYLVGRRKDSYRCHYLALLWKGKVWATAPTHTAADVYRVFNQWYAPFGDYMGDGDQPKPQGKIKPITE